ncbi:methyltransferase [Psittacicella gerlachiana]|nr:methyltransferase [Psittacicella gerlachiana]
MSKLNKILQRNQVYFAQGSGTILLGAIETDLVHEFLELVPAEHTFAVYTNQAYTLLHAVQLVARQGYKVWANLILNKDNVNILDHKKESFKLPLNLEKESIFSLSQGQTLKQKSIYFAYGTDLNLVQEKLSSKWQEQQLNLIESLEQLPLRVGKDKVDLQPSPLAQLWKLTKATNLVVFWPKSKEEFLNLVQEIKAAKEQLEDLDLSQVKIFFVGTNDSGIKTIESLLATPVRQLDNVARCRLFYSSAELEPSQKLLEKSKYTDFSLASRKIVTLPGVFSSDALDLGTKLLLETYQDFGAEHNQHLHKLFQNYNKEFDPQVTNPNLNFLDYASGAGVISQYLASLFKSKLTNPQVKQNWDLIEVHAPALICSSLNLQELAQEQVNFNLQAADSLEQALANGMPAVFYREIVSNPPFHQGNEVTFRVTENLIAQARQRLHPQGALRLVANSGLPYMQILTKYFSNINIIAKANGFTVYLARI